MEGFSKFIDSITGQYLLAVVAILLLTLLFQREIQHKKNK